MANNGSIEISFERERRTLRSLLSFFNRGHRVEHADDPAVVPPLDASKAQRYLTELERRYGPARPLACALDVDSIATLVLDASALRALGAGHERARAYLAWAVRTKTRLVVPATELLDTAAAGVAAAVADVIPIYASTAETAAGIVDRSRVGLPLDALAIALASKFRPAAVLTADAAGARVLARALDQSGVLIFAL